MEPPLTDDTGYTLATVLLSHIIKKSKLYVQSSKTGRMASVRYLMHFSALLNIYIYRMAMTFKPAENI